MRNKKTVNPLRILKVILSIGFALALMIGFFQLLPYVQSARLCTMIKTGDTEGALEYIEKIADVNEFSAPLCLRPLMNMVEADPELPLVIACNENDVQVVKALLEHGADPNLYLIGGFSPMEATFVNNKPNQLAIAELLIQYGADVDSYDSHMSGLFHQLQRYTYTPSDSVEKKEEREECILYLLSCGADCVDDNGNTIMHYVCPTGRTGFIGMLAEEYGELLDYRNNWGQTPLMWAAGRPSEEGVVFLLTHGADATATDIDGKSVLDYAQEGENQRIITLITEAIDSDITTNLASIRWTKEG